MGAAAAAGSDLVIVTDDNPRGEDPAAIRAAVLAGAPGATEMADRRAAIAHAVNRRRRHGRYRADRGQGPRTGPDHRSGRDMRVLPFDDVAVARECAAPEPGCERARPHLALAAAGGRPAAAGAVDRRRNRCRHRRASPVAISRLPAWKSIRAKSGRGDLFMALKGEAMDGHRFVDGALSPAGPRRRWSSSRWMARMCWSRIPPPRWWPRPAQRANAARRGSSA